MTGTSRRKLLTAGMAAGVLAASGLSLSAKPQQGGGLRAGLGGAHLGDGWDSRAHMGTFAICMGHGAVFDCLTEVAGDGSLRGELAENWEASSDARIWTFNLRKGVRFHNGKAFCAEDVIASLRLHQDSRSPMRPLLQNIAGIRQLRPHQVQFTLHNGYADLPYLLSDYHLVIYPAGQIAAAMQFGIGTGLYQVSEFVAGQRFLGKRVQDHYKSGSAGWFDEIEFIAINDPKARNQALLSGDVDVISGLDFSSAGTYQSRPDLRMQEVTGNRHLTFPMQADVAPFSSRHVRKALKHGIDRTAFVDTILNGHGCVAADTPIGPADQFYLPDLAPLEYDPDRARYHLAQAGLSDLHVDLAVSQTAFDGAVEAAQLYQFTASACGIAITPRVKQDQSYWSDTWRRAPFSAASWAGRATEDWMLSLAYQDAALWNDSGWGRDQHPRFQSLLAQARAELNIGLRQDLYHEMQVILRDDGSTIIPAFANWAHGMSAQINTPDDIGNLWEMDNARFAERWWKT